MVSDDFDVVIAGGRVIDPETRLDAVRHVGVKDGRIAAISESPLSGRTQIDASGLVVAPGYIDMHSHTQSIPGDRMQAYDGVTTVLELESGLAPIGLWYDNQEATGRAVNYGASVAWTFSRVAVMNPELGEPDATLQYFQRAFGHPEWSTEVSTPEQLAAILAGVEQGLKEGGIGIGINNGYAPGTGVQELAAVAELAARYEVPTYTHVSLLGNVDPRSSFEGYLRLIAFAAATGAHMHICHLNSTSLRDIARAVAAVEKAQGAGLKITVEAYPYGAGSTAIGAAMFLDPDFERRTGSTWSDIVVNTTGEEIASEERCGNCRPRNRGRWWCALPPAGDGPGTRAARHVEPLPGVRRGLRRDAVAVPDGSFLDGDVWPLPADVSVHPGQRRLVAVHLDVRQEVGPAELIDAIEKCTLHPRADPGGEHPIDEAQGAPAAGRGRRRHRVRHERDPRRGDLREADGPLGRHQARAVNGVPLIKDGELDTAVLPGRPVRRDIMVQT